MVTEVATPWGLHEHVHSFDVLGRTQGTSLASPKIIPFSDEFLQCCLQSLFDRICCEISAPKNLGIKRRPRLRPRLMQIKVEYFDWCLLNKGSS